MSVQATTMDDTAVRSRPMTREEKRVILASSLGTVFEWYDFYLYGSLAAIIGAQFFSQYPEATRNVFALLAFAAGFLVRPFGALVFGRLGDLVGRKYTFLITILIMGISTFLVGCLPSYETIGFLAPVMLIALRMAQGLALGGEYGGAAIYVAEHAPPGKRGFFTSWIQTTATLGLLLSLIIIMFTQIYVNANYAEVTTAAGAKITPFAAWGWRIPFLVSIVLLGVSVWIRLQMHESPAFKKMKEEGSLSKAPLTEAFGQWRNAKIALLALFGLVAGQAVVWYTGQFYALFFLQNILKVDAFTANVLIAWSLILGTGQLLGKVDIPHHAGQARDEPGPFNAKGRFDRLVRLACGHSPFSARAAGETSRLQPVVSGDAELPALPVTGRRELLGRHELRQIRRLVERPDFDLAPARHGIGGTLGPGHGLVHVLDLPDREAGDQLAALGERPVDDRAAGTFANDALGLDAVLETSGGNEDAGLDQLLGEPVHRCERLGRRWRALFAVLGGFRENHNPHRLSPCF